MTKTKTSRVNEKLVKPAAAKTGRLGGAPEVLTRDLARKIVDFIERMPDSDIPVTWVNIVTHVNRKFGTNLQRDVLSTKEWDGRKLIREAKNMAAEIQSRLGNQQVPKYANSSRNALRKRISDLQAKVLAMQEELERARNVQLTALDAFRLTRLDLRRLADDSQSGDPPFRVEAAHRSGVR